MYSALILICLSSLVVSSVAAWAAWGYASTSPLKRLRSVESQIADLHSSFESLLESHKRLRSKHGMTELRARTAEEPKKVARPDGSPPIGASKAELREYYGLTQPGFRIKQ